MYYIAHHGVLHMHWGERYGPPYPLDRQSAKERATVKSRDTSKMSSAYKVQLKDSDETSSTKRGAQSFYKKLKAKNEIKKQEQQKQAEESAKQREIANKEYQKSQKENILRNASAKEVMDYQKQTEGSLSNQELQAVADRLRLEQTISSYLPKTQTKTDKVINALDKLDKVKNWVNNGLSIYNNIASVYNAYQEQQGSEKRLIQTNKQQPKQDKDGAQTQQKKQQAKKFNDDENKIINNLMKNMKKESTLKNLYNNLKKSKISLDRQSEIIEEAKNRSNKQSSNLDSLLEIAREAKNKKGN